MRCWWLGVVAAVVLLAGCNLAKDTADTSEKGGAGAVGVAEKMKGGTVGNADEDTGESTDTSAAGE